MWLCIRLNKAGKYCDRSIYRRCWFWQKKIIFSDEAHFDIGGYVNKQTLRIWRTKKSARIHLKVAPQKISHCLVRLLVHRHNWAIFLRKWRRGRYSSWRSLSGHVEWIFVHKNWRGGYWQHLVTKNDTNVAQSRSYTRCFAPCFWKSHYQPQSWCRFPTSELWFDTVGLLFVGCGQR